MPENIQDFGAHVLAPQRLHDLTEVAANRRIHPGKGRGGTSIDLLQAELVIHDIDPDGGELRQGVKERGVEAHAELRLLGFQALLRNLRQPRLLIGSVDRHYLRF
jgi:nucleotide-binding universal stress UspA family protein